jgi:hypothetical protein
MVDSPMPDDDTVFVEVEMDKGGVAGKKVIVHTSIQFVVPLANDDELEVEHDRGETAKPTADADYLRESDSMWEDLLDDDRVPPVVREHIRGAEQTRFIVGDVKTLLLIESAVTKALKAAATQDKSHRRQLLRFCESMCSFGIMHGELHLFFHCLQAIFKLWFGLILQPAASLLRRTGIEPKKGPIENFAHHLNHLEKTVAALMTTMYFRMAEQFGTPEDLVTPNGELDAEVLALWIGSFLDKATTQVVRALFIEFTEASTAFLSAYPGGRAHVTTFVDVMAKEFLPYFKLLGKHGYVWAAMRSTEQTEMELSPYLRMLWAIQRTFGKRCKGAFLDEHVEDLNFWIKLLANTGSQMVTFGRMATRVQATTFAFDLMKKGRLDPGHRVGKRDSDHHELVCWLMACHVGDVVHELPDPWSCARFSKVIRSLANPSTGQALLLSLPGSMATCDQTGRKVQVVRVEHKHGTDSGLEVVLEYLHDNSLVTTDSANVDVTAAKAAAADDLRDVEKAERSNQDEIDKAMAVADEIETLAVGVGGRAVTCDRGEVAFKDSTLAKHWLAAADPPSRIATSHTIAHYFGGLDNGWYIGTVKSVKGGLFDTKYKGTNTLYPHQLEASQHMRLWVSVTPLGPDPDTVVEEPTTVEESAGAQNGGGRGRMQIPTAAVHAHAHDAGAAGILRLEGLDSTSRKTEVGNRIAYHEGRHMLELQISTLVADDGSSSDEEGADELDADAALQNAIANEARLENRNLQRLVSLVEQLEWLKSGSPGSTMGDEERLDAIVECVEQLEAAEATLAAANDSLLSEARGVSG